MHPQEKAQKYQELAEQKINGNHDKKPAVKKEQHNEEKESPLKPTYTKHQAI